jgi:hypothetical protein
MNKKSEFTLIELIVTVIILCLIGSLVWSVVSEFFLTPNQEYKVEYFAPNGEVYEYTATALNVSEGMVFFVDKNTQQKKLLSSTQCNITQK